MGVSQIIETQNGDWTSVTVITDQGHSNTQEYYLDSDRSAAIDRATKWALSEDD